MNERIKELRIALSLTQEDFGKRIGVQRAAVNKWEKGINGVADSMVLSICREFGVSEHWLRTGEGEMFEQTRETELDLLSVKYNLDGEQRSVLEGFLNLAPEERDVFLKLIRKVFSGAAQASSPASVPDAVAAGVAGVQEYTDLKAEEAASGGKEFSSAG